MRTSKVLTGLGAITAVIGIGISGIFYYQQKQIDTQASQISRKVVDKQTQLHKLQAEPIQQPKETTSNSSNFPKTKDLVNEKAHAMFKLLCTVDPNPSDRAWNSRWEELKTYADPKSLSNTTLDIMDVQDVRKQHIKSRLNDLEIACEPVKNNQIAGTAFVTTTQSGPGDPLKLTLALDFIFNTKSEKFTQIKQPKTVSQEDTD